MLSSETKKSGQVGERQEDRRGGERWRLGCVSGEARFPACQVVVMRLGLELSHLGRRLHFVLRGKMRRRGDKRRAQGVAPSPQPHGDRDVWWQWPTGSVFDGVRDGKGVLTRARRDYSGMEDCLMLGSRVVSGCAVACAKERQDG